MENKSTMKTIVSSALWIRMHYTYRRNKESAINSSKASLHMITSNYPKSCNKYDVENVACMHYLCVEEGNERDGKC
jgi:hypothetical protein